MRYEDPIITENVNVSKEPPAKTFVRLLSALAIISLVVYLLLNLFIYQLVKYISFDTEKRLFEPMAQAMLSEFVDDKHPEKDQALQQIADKLIASIVKNNPNHPLKDINITMHYSDDGMVNAFATVAGHIVVTEGLLSTMENENTLSMVVGHEIGHVVHRDALTSLGRLTLTNLVIASVLGMNGNGVTGQGFALLEYGYSRQAETDADVLGLKMLNEHYHNTQGAARLFELFAVVHPSKSKWIELSSTHPLPVNRKKNVEKLIRENHYPVNPKSTTPLPAVLRTIDTDEKKK